MTSFSLTGYKDTDRLILLKLSDKDFLNVSLINSYFTTKVCDDSFFHKRLLLTYPDTIKYKENKNWKQLFLEVVHYTNKLKKYFDYRKLKKYFDYTYTSGNYKIQYQIFSSSPYCDKDELLMRASERGEITLVKYLVKRKANIHVYDDYALRAASRNGYLEIVKYLVEHGANIHAIDNYALRMATENRHLEIVKYLQSLP